MSSLGSISGTGSSVPTVKGSAEVPTVRKKLSTAAIGPVIASAGTVATTLVAVELVTLAKPRPNRKLTGACGVRKIVTCEPAGPMHGQNPRIDTGSGGGIVELESSLSQSKGEQAKIVPAATTAAKFRTDKIFKGITSPTQHKGLAPEIHH